MTTPLGWNSVQMDHSRGNTPERLLLHRCRALTLGFREPGHLSADSGENVGGWESDTDQPSSRIPREETSFRAPISTAASAQSTCTGRWSKPLRATISLRSKSMPTRLKDSSKWPHLFKPWQFRTKSL